MTATVIAIASLIVVGATAVFVWRQARELRFALQVQSLLAVEERFNGREYRRCRHLAARQLQTNDPGADADDVLDFLEMLGLLVRRKALDVEMVYHTFFYWIDGYWRAAKVLIERERGRDPRVWENLHDLHNRVLAIENKKRPQRQEDIRDFLEYEVRQFEPREGGESAR